MTTHTYQQFITFQVEATHFFTVLVTLVGNFYSILINYQRFFSLIYDFITVLNCTKDIFDLSLLPAMNVLFPQRCSSFTLQ